MPSCGATAEPELLLLLLAELREGRMVLLGSLSSAALGAARQGWGWEGGMDSCRAVGTVRSQATTCCLDQFPQ